MASDVAEIAVMAECKRPGEAERTTELIRRARAGDAIAFDQIMLLHQRRVAATAWRILGNQEDARDAAQEVFLRVYRYLDTFKTDQDFSGWLYRIVVNVCRNIARDRSRNTHATSIEDAIEGAGLNGFPFIDDVESRAITSEEGSIVRLALEQLSEKERTALVLREFEGLSTREVAGIMKSSEVTVRSRISTARTKIKRFRDALVRRRRGAR